MMKKFGHKALALSLTAVLGASMVLTGCGGKSKNEGKKGEDSTTKIGLTTGLASDTTADISIMTWSGDSKYTKISEAWICQQTSFHHRMWLRFMQ